MQITYLGHSAFKLKGKKGSVVMDPYGASVGFTAPKQSADIVTVSHQHPDHNLVNDVSGTARRARPFLVTEQGEYEVGGISVFGVGTYHDENQGADRGSNLVFTVLLDDIRVCHLGDLGHELTTAQLEAIGSVDILLCPVGGQFTIDPQTAVKVIRSLEPSIVIPMHFKTDRHDQKTFGQMATVTDFLKAYGVDVAPMPKLEIESTHLPEETEVVVLSETLVNTTG